MATIDGDKNPNNLNDQLSGTSASDKINGLKGDDEIFGFGGNDTLNGGDGNDFLAAGNSPNGGNSKLNGDAGDDQLFGADGNDSLDGGTGKDFMEGGKGDDSYFVDSINDVIDEFPGQGEDTVNSTTANFTLPSNVENLFLLQDSGAFGGFGNDLDNKIAGNSGDNFLVGNNGDDFISGGGGNDVISGGNGFDTVNERLGGSGFITLTNSKLIDPTGTTSLFGIEAAILGGGLNSIKIDATAFTGPVSLLDSVGADVLLGGSGDDSFFTQGNGNDLYDGYGGHNKLTATVDAASVVLTNTSLKVEYSPASPQRIFNSTSTLKNIQEVSISGQLGDIRIDASKFTAGSVRLQGRGSLTGGSGNDTLIGLERQDTLIGGGGNDFLQGGAGADDFEFDSLTAFKAANFGIDTIADFRGSADFGSDKIALSSTAFTAVKSQGNPGTGVFSDSTEFTIVDSDAAAATKQAVIVYNASNGHLFYNQNGSAAGLGTGAQFATLTTSPTLHASDFKIV
jgi:Ca2+-binding RTX toxin-like protein